MTKKTKTHKYVLLRQKKHGNVFWTTDDGSDHDGYEILHRGDNPDEMISQWQKHYKLNS